MTSPVATSSSATTTTITFSPGIAIDAISDVASYSMKALDGGVPVTVLSAAPSFSIVASGSGASIVNPDANGISRRVSLPTDSLTSVNIGDYIVLTSPTPEWTPPIYLRIESIVSPTVATVDHDLFFGDPSNASIAWVHYSAVTSVLLTTTKVTGGANYAVTMNLTTALKVPFSAAANFTATTSQPRVQSAVQDSESTITVTFDQPMTQDPLLVDPAAYVITGPSTVTVKSVAGVSPTGVALDTVGLTVGSYTLTVSTSGPKDLAGNFLDPAHRTATFSGTVPVMVRSIFTDHGPIAKPPLDIATGVTGSVLSLTDVNLPNVLVGGFPTSVVGLYVTLSGTSNAGTYRIAARVSPTRLKLSASFSLPDVANGSITWHVFDPRNGEIADSPSDVTVRINGTPTVAQSVVGLLGQVVLASAPLATDDVKVDYSWVYNPTVEVRRLNSKEFVLNSWNRDSQERSRGSQHAYRYNNVLAQPQNFVASTVQAQLDQPESRDLKYRAFERAYTAALNDPNLLLLNTPTHRIAYPPLSRTISDVSIQYNAGELPENNILAPWERKGSGTSTLVPGTLTVQDTSTGPFPTGEPLFWTRTVDLTFPHVFAAAWRTSITATTTPEGVFTGVAAGWATDKRVVVLGYLLDGGVRKVGILKKGFGDATYDISSWSGGVTLGLATTGLPTVLDWSNTRSYRLFRDRDGVIRLYLDGDVIETLRITEDELPYLEELNAPFNTLEGAFFGSISRPAQSTSVWNFFRYIALPTNPEQTAPAVFVEYEANTTPEISVNPWTPVGYHGTETIIGGDFLLLDSTSATTPATSEKVGLIGGDFRGFSRLEPLLAVSSDVVLDVNAQITSYTHGITPNAIMAAIDDGSRIVQLSFLAQKASPKFSYPGRSLPGDATPVSWSSAGTATAEMLGRTLRIIDSSITDGRVYFANDLEPPTSANRIIEASIDYAFEFRVRVISHTPDAAGFSGVFAQSYEATGGKTIGLLLRDSGGIKTLAFHSDGNLLGAGSAFTFNWDDGKYHTYRVVKNTSGGLVTLFVDGIFLGSFSISSFLDSALANPDYSWGSSTTISMASQSVVDWAYSNVWRIAAASNPKYVGLWKGTDPQDLTGYLLPTKLVGKLTAASGSDTLTGDGSVNFSALGIAVGDHIILDCGPNKGTYEITAVFANALQIDSPLTGGAVDYRIPQTTDWTTAHRYRIVRDPGGAVSVLLDAVPTPLIRTQYSEISLPPSSVGVPKVIASGLPSVTFGAFDPTNLSQSRWDFVRYGITRSLTETRIVPGHQVLNQRNVMSSPEHLTSTIAHSHTDFWSSSTGIPPRIDPDFLKNASLASFTRLNEGTPLVPSTQTYEVRKPTPVFEFVSGINRVEDVLNSDLDFLLNDGATRVRIAVPDDVLYNSLDVIEESSGTPELLAPLAEQLTGLGTVYYQKEVCLKYTGDVLPEEDTTASTPWVLASDTPNDVTTWAFAGILTYSVGASGSRTIYRNATPLPDAVSLTSQAKFNFKVVNDASGGTGDSGIRLGLSALGLTAQIAFVTSSLGQRYVELQDGLSGAVLGAVLFDYLDGNYHVYRIVKNPTAGTVQLFIDS